ncbi:imm11 family protein [Ruegeria meonggei]|uniref:imm11 family protein n=1 Tax=Ruegeria meonggei TaxID=1446476 RepID=UPI003670CF6B
MRRQNTCCFPRKPKKLPDIFSARNGVRIITDRVRQILEDFDPGVHQIIPIEAVYKDGSKPDALYFF